MARILAVNWDSHEARCVLASATGGRLRILSAKSVGLVDVAEGGQSHPDVSGSLRAMLDEMRPGRCEVLVAVDRASVELLNFTLPPAKDSELAGLVAMQVLRESQTADESSIVDFVPLAEGERVSGTFSGGGSRELEDAEPEKAPDTLSRRPRQVMAAVLSSQQLGRILDTCRDAGLKPSRILLRPLAAASLFARRVSPEERNCLLVNLVADEADLLILVDGRIVFQRTVRLPEEAAEETLVQRLSAEVGRTLVVAQQGPLGGNSVERIYVFGGAEEWTALADQLGAVLSVPVSIVDPFEITDAPDDGPPEHPGRFAALVGMILDESYGSHAVDFLHPRRPPRQTDRRQVAMVIAAGVVLAVLAAGYHVWSQAASDEDRIRGLAAELKEKDDVLKRTAEQSQRIDAIADWQAGEVVWLDELRELSLRLPVSRDLVLMRMSMTPERSGGGNVDFSGLVRDPLIVARMEQNLRDQFHDVRSKRIQERGPGKGYSWGFETSVSIGGRDKQSYLAAQAPGR